MALAFTFVAAAMFIAASVDAQCPVCDPNNGAQTVCVKDQTTGALQQFISLCEMDLFNCQQNQNVFTPLYYGACQSPTAVAAPTYTYPSYTNQVPWYSSVGAPSVYYGSGTPSTYYGSGTPSTYYGTSTYPATAPNYLLSGTDPNGDWSVRLLSNINPAFLASRVQKVGSANPYLLAQKSSAGTVVPVGSKALLTSSPTTNPDFSSLAGKKAYQPGAVYNFALKTGVGGGFAVVSKSGMVANSVGTNTVGTAGSKLARVVMPVSPAKLTTNVVVQKPWASNKGSVGRVPSVLGTSGIRQG